MRDDERPTDSSATDDQDDELVVTDLDGGRSQHTALARTLGQAWSDSRRGKRPPRRILWSAGVLLALAILLLASDALPRAQNQRIVGADPVPIVRGAAIPSTTIAGSPPGRIGGGPWERISLVDVPGTAVRTTSPSPSNPSTILACTGAAHAPYDNPPAGPIAVWRTLDAGAHWVSLALPSLVGTWCDVRMAADGSERVSLMVLGPDDASLYVSSDSGDSWVRITAPPILPAHVGFVSREFWATAHHLFIWYEYDAYDTFATAPTGTGTESITHYESTLIRSDDDGRTWQRAEGGLGDAEFYAYQTHDENRLVTRIYSPLGQSGHAELWETRDAGQSWHDAGTIGKFAGLLVVPTGGSDDVLARVPDYATLDEQIPSSLFRLGVREQMGTGQWIALPPLPVPGARPDRIGLLQVFEEANDGRLIAFGVDPHAGVPAESEMRDWKGMQAQWLWVWDERIGRWLVEPAPLPVSYRWSCGACLEHHATWATGPLPHGGTATGTYLWLREDPGIGLGYGDVAYRIFVPDAPPGDLLW